MQHSIYSASALFSRGFLTRKIEQIRQILDNTASLHIPNGASWKSNTCCSVFASIEKKSAQRLQENPVERLRTWPTPQDRSLRKRWSSSGSYKHHKEVASVLWIPIRIENCSIAATTGKGRSGQKPNEKSDGRSWVFLSYWRSVEKTILTQLTDPLNSSHLTHKFQSAYSAGHAQYQTCSSTNCRWHSHSFWCQPSFYPDPSKVIGCFWHPTTPYCWAVLNNISVSPVWPSASLSHTYRRGCYFFSVNGSNPRLSRFEYGMLYGPVLSLWSASSILSILCNVWIVVHLIFGPCLFTHPSPPFCCCCCFVLFVCLCVCVVFCCCCCFLTSVVSLFARF